MSTPLLVKPKSRIASASELYSLINSPFKLYTYSFVQLVLAILPSAILVFLVIDSFCLDSGVLGGSSTMSILILYSGFKVST